MSNVARLRLAALRDREPAGPPPDLEPSLVSTLLTPLRALGEAVEFVDAPTRAALGRLTGVQGSGRSTMFGFAPTGDELFEGVTGIRLAPNTPGDAEWRDVPGFLTEVAASPLNLVGIGSLTKGGQAASRLGRLERRIGGLKATGAPRRAGLATRLREALGGQADDVGAEIAELTQMADRQRSVLRQLGMPEELGSTLRQQGRLGQRRFLDIAGLPVLPRIADEMLLGASGAIGRGIAKPFRPLARAFRPAGLVAENAKVELGNRTVTGQQYNELVRGGEQAVREMRRLGGELSDEIGKTLKAYDKKHAGATLEKLVADLTPEIDRTIAGSQQIARLTKQIKKIEADPDADPLLLAAFQRRKDMEVRRLKLLAGTQAADPRVALLTLGVEQSRVPAKLAWLEQRTLLESSALVSQLKAQQQAALNAGMGPGFGSRAAQLQARITRVTNVAATRIADLQRRGALSQKLLAALPPEIVQQAHRINLLSDHVLDLEQALGVPVSELTDPALTYLHRALTPEGLTFARVLGEAQMDTPFNQFARQFTVNKTFTARRTQALHGMGVMQINDFARHEAGVLREQLAKTNPEAAARIQFSPNDSFFMESPAEVAIRRFSLSGRSQQSAMLARGVVDQFSFDRKFARPGDVPIEEFLAKMGLRKLDDVKIGDSEAAIRSALAGSGFEGRVIPREFAAEATKVMQIFNTPEELQKVAGFFDKYNAMMRFWVTVPFPSYHIRNAASNVFLTWLAGMSDPTNFAKAMRLQYLAKQAKRGGASASPEARQALDLLRKLTDEGAAGDTITHELAALSGATGPVRGLPKAIGDPAHTTGGRFGMNIATDIENNAKVALYLDGKSKGLSDIEAVERVKKYLFNYSDLSQIEKHYIRRWAFFYTFQRKAVPLMLESLVRNPGKMRATLLAGGQTDDKSPQARWLPEYQRDRNPLALWRNADGTRTFLDLGLPVSLLGEFGGESQGPARAVQRIGQKMLAQLAPPLQHGLQLATGTNLSTGEPLARRSVGDAILSATPLSRFLTLGRGLMSDRPFERTGGTLLGASMFRADPSTAPDALKKQRAEAMLADLALRGRARQYSIFGAVDEDADVQALNALRGRLQRRLSGD